MYTYGDTSRIDFILLSMHSQENLVSASIGPRYFSDHSLVTISVKFGENFMVKIFARFGLVRLRLRIMIQFFGLFGRLLFNLYDIGGHFRYLLGLRVSEKKRSVGPNK